MSTVKGIAARNVLMSGQSGRRENCNMLQKSLVNSLEKVVDGGKKSFEKVVDRGKKLRSEKNAD